MFQLWTTSALGKLPLALRKELIFYAPLTESLDFMGIDPVSYTRASGNVWIGRDGLLHSMGPNVPRFDFTGELPLGLLLSSVGNGGGTLQYSAANSLNDANTLIWFEENGPKSTPANPNPFASDGHWAGSLDVHIKHIAKARRTLSISEIQSIQLAFGDVVQDIQPIVVPPLEAIGSFIKEAPGGVKNSSNVTFTLSQNPVAASVVLVAHGVVCELVDVAPGPQQFTLSGIGFRTITMGLAPSATGSFFANYVIAP